MNAISRKQLRIATLVYWILLLYIVAALVWWFIALQQQNLQMVDLKMQKLDRTAFDYASRLHSLTEERDRKTAQYTGEGVTFLLLILLGALFVYRAVRKQLSLQVQEKNFMMAVTHELKTPIAVARLNLETLRKYELDTEKRNRLIRAALQETQRLETLAANILLSSRLEGQGSGIEMEPLDFSELVNRIIGEFSERYPSRTWVNKTIPGLWLKGDAFLLQMLVNNLINNAIQYSPSEKQIEIVLQKTGKKIALEVKDEGPGIPGEEQQKIFKKFYRVGNEQGKSAKGTGLGLYLCRKIAEDHKGTISVSNRLPAGSIFTVWFPAL